jgi:hypothetical protein
MTSAKPLSMQKQRGRKGGNKGLMRIGQAAPVAPAMFADPERDVWSSIVADPAFVASSVNLSVLTVACEAHMVLRCVSDDIRALLRQHKPPMRRLYDTQTRAIKTYCVALQGLGVLEKGDWR